MSSPTNKKFAKLLFSEEKRLKVYRKLASLIKNGTGVDDAVDYLYRRASQNGKNPGNADAVVFGDWLRHIRNGRPLHEALHEWAPNGERMIIAAGERGGALAANLTAVCEVVESNRKMRGAILSSVYYPVMLMAAALGVVSMFGIKVIPMFAKISNPETWSGAAYSMYVVSQFVTSIWIWVFFATMIGLLWAVLWSLPRLCGRPRVYLDKVMPWSIYRLWVGSGFIKSLEALVRSGEPIQKAMMELRKNASPYLKERLDAGITGMKAGHNLGVALERSGYQFPDKEIIEDLVLYAEQSEFDVALEIIGREWLANGVKIVEARANLLNVMAKAAMGLVVVWIVYGTFGLQNTMSDAMTSMGGPK